MGMTETISRSDIDGAILVVSYLSLNREEIQLLIKSKYETETIAAIQLLSDKKIMASYRVGRMKLYNTFGRLFREWDSAISIDCIYLPELYLWTSAKFKLNDIKKILPRLEGQIDQYKLISQAKKLVKTYVDVSLEKARSAGVAKGLDKKTIDSILNMILMYKATRS